MIPITRVAEVAASQEAVDFPAGAALAAAAARAGAGSRRNTDETPMKHSHFIQQIDEAKISAAMAVVAHNTSGAIRLLISKRPCSDPLLAAEQHFRALHLHKRPGHDAILIFVAPESHTFALYGDSEVHEKFGDALWEKLRDEISGFLKQARFTDGLVHAIQRAGELLAAHFPPAKKVPFFKS
jgi:uncharacterized membrane protein